MGFLHCRQELKAARKMLLRYFLIIILSLPDIFLIRSNLHHEQLLRLSGVRLLHTSNRRLEKHQDDQEDDKDDKDDKDDEKDRMLSLLKTAFGFLAVPLLLVWMFGREGPPGAPGENASSLDKAQVWILRLHILNSCFPPSQPPYSPSILTSNFLHPELLTFFMLTSQRPGQPVGEIQWADFHKNLLLRGEVQEIVIHAGVNR